MKIQRPAARLITLLHHVLSLYLSRSLKKLHLFLSPRHSLPQFYTEKLGFVKKLDISLGVDNSWLMVVAKEEQNGTEVLLEPAPNHFEPTKVYSEALFDAGILVEI